MKNQPSRKGRTRIRLPLVSKTKSFVPRGVKCPWCGETSRLKQNSFAVLSGGALVKDKSGKFSIEDKRLTAWLNLDWQGGPADGKTKQGADVGTGLALAWEVAGGQFNLNFCGTKCLRAFLNYCVDELERKVKWAKESGKRRATKLKLHR
jgi:hypothetical protein